MDDLRDLAQPDDADIDLLHWPSPHRPCPFRTGDVRSRCRREAHCVPTGLGIGVSWSARERVRSRLVLQISCGYTGGVAKTDYSAYRIVRRRRRLLRQRRDTRVLDIAHSDVTEQLEPAQAGRAGLMGLAAGALVHLPIAGRLVEYFPLAVALRVACSIGRGLLLRSCCLSFEGVRAGFCLYSCLAVLSVRLRERRHGRTP